MNRNFMGMEDSSSSEAVSHVRVAHRKYMIGLSASRCQMGAPDQYRWAPHDSLADAVTLSHRERGGSSDPTGQVDETPWLCRTIS